MWRRNTSEMQSTVIITKFKRRQWKTTENKEANGKFEGESPTVADSTLYQTIGHQDIPKQYILFKTPLSEPTQREKLYV